MAESRNRAFAKLAKDVTAKGNIKAEGISSDVTLGGATVYATRAAMPMSGNTSGDQAYVTENNRLYIWNGSGWFSVALINTTPTITNAPSSVYNLYANGSPTIITLAATDEDGDTLTWSYSSASASGKATITQADNVFTITPLTDIADTSFTIDFQVTDGVNISTASSTVNIDNRAPVIDTGPSATYALATDGSPTVITLAATDPDGGSITWSYANSALTNQATVVQNGNEFTITPNSTPAAYADFTLTFTASDSIESTSTDATTFSLTFILVADGWDKTVLSIGTSSTNSLGNNTFIDRSTNAWGSTVNTWGTSFSQTAFHPYLDNWSVEFDGTGDYLDGPSTNTVTNFGTGDFTVEFWFYTNTTASQQNLLDNIGNSSYAIYIPAGGASIRYYVGGDKITGEAISSNTWHHVALVRSSSSTKLYLNGTQIGSTYSDSNNYAGASNFPRIGGAFNGTVPINGYMSNVRIVKGTAVYTSNFTPSTTPLTDVSGTSLLTCQSNRFIDASVSAHAITVAGDPAISAFNPFGQGSEYAVGENKGSVSFTTTDGIDLKVKSSGAASTWTIECWYKFDPTSTIDANHYLFDARGTAGSQTAGSLYLYRTNTANYSDGGNWGITDANFNDGAWHWFTMVSDGTNRAVWIDGIRIAELGGTRTVGTHLWINSRNTDQYHNDCDISDFRFSSTARYATSSTTISVPTSPVGTDGNTTAYYPFDNAGIFDKTGNYTLTGTATTTTGNVAVASSSINFNNNPLKLTGGVSTLSGDFTIEFWAECNAAGQACILFDNHETYYNGNFSMRSDYVSGSISRMYGSVGGHNFNFQYPVADFLNTTAHWAITREGSSVKIFLNGVQKNTTGTATGTSDLSNGFYIGGAAGPISGYSNLTGIMEGFQILHGVAKYTSNFTPPTQEQGRSYQAES